MLFIYSFHASDQHMKAVYHFESVGQLYKFHGKCVGFKYPQMESLFAQDTSHIISETILYEIGYRKYNMQ